MSNIHLKCENLMLFFGIWTVVLQTEQIKEESNFWEMV